MESNDYRERDDHGMTYGLSTMKLWVLDSRMYTCDSQWMDMLWLYIGTKIVNDSVTASFTVVRTTTHSGMVAKTSIIDMRMGQRLERCDSFAWNKIRRHSSSAKVQPILHMSTAQE